MAPVYRAGLGPTFLEALMLQTSGQINGGSIVTTTDGDAAAPPVTNCYWIRETSVSGTNIFDVGPGGAALTPLGFEWPVCAAHRVEGTLAVANAEDNVCRFDMDGGGEDCLHRFDQLTASTFRYRISQAGGGDSAYGATRNVSTNYALRWQFDGTNWKLYVDGVEDISIAVSEKPLKFYQTSTLLATNVKQYWCGLCWRGSNDNADRPNTTLTVEGPNPSADNESGDYGDETDCDQTVSDGVFGDWDENSGTPDASDTSIYLCELGGEDGTETSELDNLTMTTPKLFVVRQLGRDNVGGKTVSTFCRILDGDGTPNIIEIQHTNISTNSFRGYSRAFPTAPDGGAWTQAEVNDLKSGVRSINTNGANDEWAMMRPEVFDLGDDPPSLVIPHRPVSRLVGR